jgi:predicted DNA-binding protein
MRISEELEARLLAAAIARGVPTAVHVREALDADLRTMGF